VLSQYRERTEGEDGYLRMGEIEGLDIEAEFVNLSACETGLGQIYGGEGVVGLTHSFLVGGANGLSVSLWQVADESTMEFMVNMYRLVREKGMRYDRAITEIKRDFIGGRYSDPFYWAPFVYYGN
jgi:CHAT domain-containing protein